jgi:hypothetical protein
MKTQSKTRAIVIVVLLLLASCGESGPAVPSGPGEPIGLSSTAYLEGFPLKVVPYGASQALTLADLELEQDGDYLYGTVHYDRHEEEEFALVVHCTTPDQTLIGYTDPEKNLTVSLPRGAVLFGTNGYRADGGKSGTIEFSLQLRAPNTYSIKGSQGSVFVFAVPGEVNPHSILPTSQQDPEAFQASSNVLEQSLDF